MHVYLCGFHFYETTMDQISYSSTPVELADRQSQYTYGVPAMLAPVATSGSEQFCMV